MAEDKDTAVAIPREEIPADLSGIDWHTLQKTARALGLNAIQKRPQLEFAIHVALGREAVPPDLQEPDAETGPPGPAGEGEPLAASDPVSALEASMAEVQEMAEPEPERPHFDVETLPDLARGERPPEPEPVAPEPPVQEPVAPAAAAQAEAPTLPDAAGDQDGEKPVAPMLWYSHAAELTILVAHGKSGYFDSDRFWHEPIPAKSIEFGKNGNAPCAFYAKEQWQVDAIQASKKRKHGACWPANRHLKTTIQQKEAELAILKAMAEGGDSIAIGKRIAAARGEVGIVTGARTTRSTATPRPSSTDFPGMDALLQSCGGTPAQSGGQVFLGAAYRDAIRTAEAKGQIK